MATAFLILAHHAPDQLARLVAALPAGAPVFIHFDARARAEHYERARRLLGMRENVTFVTRHRCRWGDVGIVEGTFELIRAALGQGAPFDYAALLSGQDYPIKSNAQLGEFLERNRGAEFIESFPLLRPNRWSGHGGNFDAKARALGRFLRVGGRVLRMGTRALPEGIEPHGGSQWWCLSKECLQFIAGYVDERPDVAKFLRGTFIPDEIFFHTIVSNSPFKAAVAQHDLTFAVWDRPTPPYPAVLGADDLPALRASPKPFARKFAWDGGRLYDMIDRELRAVPEARAASSAGRPQAS